MFIYYMHPEASQHIWSMNWIVQVQCTFNCIYFILSVMLLLYSTDYHIQLLQLIVQSDKLSCKHNVVYMCMCNIMFINFTIGWRTQANLVFRHDINIDHAFQTGNRANWLVSNFLKFNLLTNNQGICKKIFYK